MRRSFFALARRVLPSGMVADGTFADSGHLTEGSMTMPDGRVYTGTFSASSGAPLANTRLEEDGDAYRGEFNDLWQRNGRGEAWLADGTHYQGKFVDDELVEGVVKVPKGMEGEVVFSGTLKDEMFLHGTLQQANYTYTGEFQNNTPTGRGKLQFTSGAVLEGMFLNGKLHGSGMMRLESGWVYIGEFQSGHVVRGELRTPTYTYDGEFDDDGLPSGEGIMDQLVTTPRLTFTGLWMKGVMMQGTVVDEYGMPVDWQDRTDLQSQVRTDEQIANDRFVTQKVKGAREMLRDRDAAYAEDAETVKEATGQYPTKLDLGYEKGLSETINVIDSDDERKEMFSIKARSKEATEGVNRVTEQMGEKADTKAAKSSSMDQERANVTQTHRIMKQFDQFKRSEGKGKDSADPRLNIETNAAWKAQS